LIRLEKASKRFPGASAYAVRDVDLTVEEGELVVLLGTSGCGKTTTLKLMNRLLDCTSGRIEIDGEDISGVDPVDLRRRIGYVFQGVGLFPHFSVARNVAAVPELLGWPAAQIRRRVDELLDLVKLPAVEYRDRMPSQLSGGQRQRVGLARALAARPRLMLLDEPLGALDPITRDGLQEEYRRIHDDLGLTGVMVTHDMTEALLMADRIAVMDAGEVLQVGTPHELLAEPAHEYVAELMRTPRRQADRLEELAGGRGPAAPACG
jgi:osmoprotectant transport system ATP-binding protein